MSPLSLNMPSILNTPTNEIQIHFFRLPVAQWEVLLVSILTDPVLYESIITSPCYRCYNPFPSSFHFTFYSCSLSTYLER